MDGVKPLTTAVSHPSAHCQGLCRQFHSRPPRFPLRNITLVHLPQVLGQLVLPAETVATAAVAAGHGAGIFFLVGIGVHGGDVAFEVGFAGAGVAASLEEADVLWSCGW